MGYQPWVFLQKFRMGAETLVSLMGAVNGNGAGNVCPARVRASSALYAQDLAMEKAGFAILCQNGETGNTISEVHDDGKQDGGT